MKFLLVALSLVAMSQASLIAFSPAIGGHLPILAPASWPIAYASHPQILLHAPAPVIQPGYVAATRGSLHIAPLPGNTPYASHHLNLAPAA